MLGGVRGRGLIALSYSILEGVLQTLLNTIVFNKVKCIFTRPRNMEGVVLLFLFQVPHKLNQRYAQFIAELVHRP